MQLAPPEQTTVLPPESVFDVPENWRHSRRHMERVVLAGIGPVPSKLMFVTSSVLDEDTIEQELGAATGRSFVRPPALLKGPHGQALKDICVSVGISMSADVYFTALCKWLLPQDKRLNPKAGDVGPGVRCFEREMAEVKPDIVVVFGKAAFEFMVPCRIKFGDAIGAWFWSERFMCRVMPMSHYYYIAAKPEWTERFRTDFAQVRMELASLNGVHVAKVPLHYRTISNSDELRDLMSEISQHLVWSVDCEWHGTNHIDGELRSLQIAWLPGHAAYIRFRDEKRRYVFDVSYEEAGAIIAPVWNRPELKAVGHHIAADLPWMSHVLGLEWYDKVRLDTEFAYQCCNEHGERGLERMSVRYTDLGRYEMDLEAWKRDHKEDSEGGYGLVPDKIIIPYACLRQDSLVQLGSGKWETIRKLVTRKYNGTVRALVGNEVKPCKVVNWYSFNAKQKAWFKLRTRYYQSGRHGILGPAFTPDHKVLTQRGKVEVQHLVLGVDAIATSYRCFDSNQMSIFLAILLGDGGVCKRNGAWAGITMSQHKSRGGYLKWKAQSLFGISAERRLDTRKRQHHFRSEYSPYIAHLMATVPRHTKSTHARRKLVFNSTVASTLGVLGLAVWYQDDGGITSDGECRITARMFDAVEVDAALSWFSSLGIAAKYREDQGHFCWSRANSKGLINLIAPYMHPDCQYKTGGRHLAELALVCADESTPLFYETVDAIVDVSDRGRKGDGTRYCLEVREAGNFLTKVGFVSNCKDVDTPLRAYPYIERDLEQQGMLEYYRHMMNPFISNVFTSFALVGLPLNYQLLDEMRDLYEFARQEIELEFRNSLYEEAWELLAANIIRALPDMRHADTPAVEAYAKLMTPTLVGRLKGQVQAASEGLPLAIPETALLPAVRDAFMSYGLQHADLETACNRVAASVSHVLTAKQFNLRSSAQMKAWLFDVKGYTPVKSTANKEKGIPAMDWAKVMEFRPDRRAGISPAVDKQTLQILAKQHGDDMLQKLLELNAVGNICKAFLKQPIRDENGVITEEAGLPAFIASDGRVHGQFSMTETARPRSWKPNSLNWPSYLQDNVKDGIHRALKMAYKADRLPAKFHEYLEDRKVLSLRSCVQASTGTVFIESDFATAEIRALAFRSGDPKLIDIMTKPDDQFALTKLKSGKGEPLVCRIRFADDCGIDAAHRDPKFLMHVWDENKMLHKVEDSDLLRTPSGALVHPSHDLHWSLVEMVRKVPREVLKKKSDRGAGKVGNFCIAEDEMVLTHLGLVPIQSVLLTHLLWDGIAWVPHEGVVLTGCEVTHTYQGLRATDNHEVWVVKLGKVSFGEARTKGLTLVRSAEGEWVRRCRWVDASEAGYSLEIQDALIQREWPAQVRHEPSKVYDILNAGPRHRFTCSGVLVSNSSAYGATGATLERKIESDTGIKPEPGTGQKILDALTARQPTAAAFLKELEKAPENPGYLRAASGKVRHFVLPPDVYGLSSRMRKSLISAQGREARNFYMQESVAATAMRAGNWLLAFARKHGLVGRAITILYDSVVTWAPIQERAIWSKAHELCMYLANGWYYHERVLRYPIDTELNTGWSLTPGDDPRNKHLAKLIPDMTWAGTPEHLQPLEKWLDSMIDFYRANEFASLDFSGLA